jgi:hypothetical protein
MPLKDSIENQTPTPLRRVVRRATSIAAANKSNVTITINKIYRLSSQRIKHIALRVQRQITALRCDRYFIIPRL